MNQEQIRNDWEFVSAQIKSHWPALTEKDLEYCFNNIEHLPERILKRYDWDLDKAQSQYEELLDQELNAYKEPQMYANQRPGAEVPAHRT